MPLNFRNHTVPQSDTICTINDENILNTMQYKSLGILLSEHLDARSANRALGPIIAKS